MPTPVRDKYYLKSLHEEIALFDRKLAHLLRYETFASEKDRNAAAAKMSVKRGQLVQTARSLVEGGIEFQPSQLPRSLRPEEPAEGAAATENSSVATAVETIDAPAQPDTSSNPRALPFRDDVREYLLNRKKMRQN